MRGRLTVKQRSSEGAARVEKNVSVSTASKKTATAVTLLHGSLDGPPTSTRTPWWGKGERAPEGVRRGPLFFRAVGVGGGNAVCDCVCLALATERERERAARLLSPLAEFSLSKTEERAPANSPAAHAPASLPSPRRAQRRALACSAMPSLAAHRALRSMPLPPAACRASRSTPLLPPAAALPPHRDTPVPLLQAAGQALAGVALAASLLIGELRNKKEKDGDRHTRASLSLDLSTRTKNNATHHTQPAPPPPA
jgi:hypothetical protein